MKTSLKSTCLTLALVATAQTSHAAIIAITGATSTSVASNGTSLDDMWDGVLATSTATFGTGSPTVLTEANKLTLVSNNALGFDGGTDGTWTGHQYLSDNNNGRTFTFTVGSDSTIRQMLLWNYSQTAIRGLDAITSIELSMDNGTTWTPNFLSSNWNLLDAGAAGFDAQVFDFSSDQIGVERIRLTVAQGDTGSGQTAGGFDEVAFSSIPEPSAALLGGLGLLALLRRRRA